MARKLRERHPEDSNPAPGDSTDFNLVLFASAKIDYDFIMGLVSRGGTTQQIRASRDDATRLLAQVSNFDDLAEIAAYIDSLEMRQYDEKELHAGFASFKAKRKQIVIDTLRRHMGCQQTRFAAFCERS